MLSRAVIVLLVLAVCPATAMGDGAVDQSFGNGGSVSFAPERFSSTVAVAVDGQGRVLVRGESRRRLSPEPRRSPQASNRRIARCDVRRRGRGPHRATRPVGGDACRSDCRRSAGSHPRRRFRRQRRPVAGAPAPGRRGRHRRSRAVGRSSRSAHSATAPEAGTASRSTAPASSWPEPWRTRRPTAPGSAGSPWWRAWETTAGPTRRSPRRLCEVARAGRDVR